MNLKIMSLLEILNAYCQPLVTQFVKITISWTEKTTLDCKYRVFK